MSDSQLSQARPQRISPRRRLELNSSPPHRIPTAPATAGVTRPETGLILGRPSKQQSRQVSMGFALPGHSSDAPTSRDLMALQGEGHAIVSGPTGSGKSAGILIPTLLTYSGSVVAIDVKGELARATAHRRTAFGPVHIVDPFSIVADATDGLNPLDLIDFAAPGEEYDLAAEIASLLAKPQGTTDPYWTYAAGTMLTRYLTLLLSHLPHGPTRTIAALRRLIDLHGSELGRLLAYAWMSPAGRGEVSALVGSFDLAAQTLSCVVHTAATMLAPFAGIASTRALERTTIDLRRFLTGQPTTIFFVIPPHRIHSHSDLLRVWTVMLVQLLFRRLDGRGSETLFLLDEAAHLGKLDVLPVLYTLARGFGIRTVSCWQDLDQISYLYRDDARVMLQNSAAVLQLATDPVDAHANLTRLLGHPPTSRAHVATAHLARERRAIPLEIPLYFRERAFAQLSVPLAESDKTKPRTRHHEALGFNTAQAQFPPPPPALPEAQSWWRGLTAELRRYAPLGDKDDAARSSAEANFRAIVARLIS